LEGESVGPVGPIEAVESNGNSTELYGRDIPIQPVLRVLSVLPATAVDAVASTVNSNRNCGPWRSIRMPLQGIQIESIPMEEEVSFILKDTPLDLDRSQNTWT